MIIKVAEAKISDKPKTIKVEMTEDEALVALACVDTMCEHYAEQLACPNLRTRRALKDKIAAGIAGANANELKAAIRAVKEGGQNA